MERSQRWWTQHRSQVLILVAEVVVFVLVSALLGATKCQDNNGGSYWHAVGATILIVAAMGGVFIVVALVWAFLDDRAPFDRPGRRGSE